MQRKLAAIMFTDIAGYTDLSAKDEKKALKILETQNYCILVYETFNFSKILMII